MRQGDTVIYLADRSLYGPGRYVDTTNDGRIVVEFTDGYRAEFHAHELDTADRAYLSEERA